MSDHVDLSVVVPVFNEKESLPALDNELQRSLSAMDRSAEVIYVDDSSTDGSYELMEGLAKDQQGVPFRRRVVRLRRNYGQTTALAAGIDAADGAIIVTLDADGQNNPADIEKLVCRLEEGWDVVSGWRRLRKDKAVSRRFPSRVANVLVSWVSGVRLRDSGCSLKAYRADVLRGIGLYGEMHRLIPAYLAQTGARITEVEVDHRPRVHGRSHYGYERIVKVLLDLILIRFMSRYFNRPMHFFGKTALLLLTLSFGSLLLMVVFKFGWLRLVGIEYQASFIQTPLPSLAATFLVGAFCSLFFGIIGEVIMRAYHEARDVKPWAVESTWNSDRSVAVTHRSTDDG